MRIRKLGMKMVNSNDKIIETLTKKIKSKLYSPNPNELVQTQKTDKWVESDEFNEYVSRSMYGLLARTYLTNLVLAGRVDEDTFDQFLTLGETEEGVRLIAVNMMSLSLEVDHTFNIPDEFKMLLQKGSNDTQDTYYK